MKQVINSIKNSWLDFLVLGAILLFGSIFFANSSHNLFRQRISLFFTAIAYVVWGIVHHWRQDDLNLKIVLEYIFTAVIGVSIAYFVLLSI